MKRRRKSVNRRGSFEITVSPVDLSELWPYLELPVEFEGERAATSRSDRARGVQQPKRGRVKPPALHLKRK